jgi:hypothetical protein
MIVSYADQVWNVRFSCQRERVTIPRCRRSEKLRRFRTYFPRDNESNKAARMRGGINGINIQAQARSTARDGNIAEARGDIWHFGVASEIALERNKQRANRWNNSASARHNFYLVRYLVHELSTFLASLERIQQFFFSLVVVTASAPDRTGDFIFAGLSELMTSDCCHDIHYRELCIVRNDLRANMRMQFIRNLKVREL